jgi:hypothetical protein
MMLQKLQTWLVKNMNNFSRCVILASGSSIREYLWHIPVTEIPIWNAIKSECLFTLNWSFLFCEPTVALYGDYQFYYNEKDKLDKLPMVISIKVGYYDRKDSVKIGNNVILLPGSNDYHKEDSWKKGFYSRHLTSIWAINFALRCGFEEIFILGMDAIAINGHTHFYDDNPKTGHYTWNNQEHSGVGLNNKGHYKTGAYNTPNKLNDYWYKPFENERNKIINVSPNSAIDIFAKWNYEQFYRYLKENPIQINREETRQEIKELIKNKS